MTSCLNDPPLMEGKGTKAATAETAAAAGKAELDLLDGINAAVLFIHGMVVSHVGEVIGIIHLLSSQRLLRRILYHIGLFIIGLYQCFCHIGVCVAVLRIEALCIVSSIGGELRIRGQQNIVINAV